jgi:DNA-binding transcriptional MerR regulator
MYSTREFAELTGVTVKALRHYERIGLLAPKRTDARYRRYAFGDLQRFERSLALKSLGPPLRMIKTLLERGDVPLRAHREALEQKGRGSIGLWRRWRGSKDTRRPAEALRTLQSPQYHLQRSHLSGHHKWPNGPANLLSLCLVPVRSAGNVAESLVHDKGKRAIRLRSDADGNLPPRRPAIR